MSVCTECVGYIVDYSNYQTSLVIMASSNSATAPSALIGSGGQLWKASVQDVDADGDFIFSLTMTEFDRDAYIASLSVDVANVDVVMLYVQCLERRGRWSVATAPVRYNHYIGALIVTLDYSQIL